MKVAKSEYVSKRTALIPQAEAICNRALGVCTKRDRREEEWTRMFLRTMDRLWLLESLKEKQIRMTNELARVNARLSAAIENLEAA